MLAFRSVVSVLLRALETFLYTLKAGPAGGRPATGTGNRAPSHATSHLPSPDEHRA
jgi:hypothetical protein